MCFFSLYLSLCLASLMMSWRVSPSTVVCSISSKSKRKATCRFSALPEKINGLIYFFDVTLVGAIVNRNLDSFMVFQCSSNKAIVGECRTMVFLVRRNISFIMSVPVKESRGRNSFINQSPTGSSRRKQLPY